MLNKFIFSLLDFILFLVAFVMLAFLPVWNYLVGSGTPLKTCTMPPMWAFIIGMYQKLYCRLMVLGTATKHVINHKLISNNGATPYTAGAGLPFQAGAMQGPSGQLA